MSGPFGFGFGATGLLSPEEFDSGNDPNESLVAQLAGLYQEKQELQAALGVSTSSEVIAYVAAQQSEGMVASLTDQLFSLYSEHEELQDALGRTAPAEIIAMVNELRSSLRILIDDSRRRLDYEATLLETHERYLA
jgi:hypothetical protein